MKSIYQRLNLPNFSPVFGLTKRSSLVNRWPPRKSDNSPELYDGKYLCYARYARYAVDLRYHAYVETLVPELTGVIRDIGLQHIFNEIKWPQGTLMQPHTDGMARGRHCLQFLIETGGENVTTAWWQEKNFPLVRTPRNLSDRVISKDDLTKVTEVTLAKNAWTIFRTDIIHDVKIIQTSRIAFTVGFSDDAIFETIVNKYGIQ